MLLRERYHMLITSNFERRILIPFCQTMSKELLKSLKRETESESAVERKESHVKRIEFRTSYPIPLQSNDTQTQTCKTSQTGTKALMPPPSSAAPISVVSCGVSTNRSLPIKTAQLPTYSVYSGIFRIPVSEKTQKTYY